MDNMWIWKRSNYQILWKKTYANSLHNPSNESWGGAIRGPYSRKMLERNPSTQILAQQVVEECVVGCPLRLPQLAEPCQVDMDNELTNFGVQRRSCITP